ncbi:MAG TPA: YggS family pyridoxal phosphate-dependent enzyme [Thermoanaerobaculia bacterium]|nr:YggS family pyridoxal phosphate-dependent enzyme [Thermoanaerobaculia bacterium]
MSRADEIRANFDAVESRIQAACARAGRKREEVTLVAVTKTFPASDVELAIQCGATHVGENKVQEGRDKRPDVASPAQWHLIGHLQSNKAKDAVKLFDVIQSVDSLDLAVRLARIADAMRKRQQILLQVNIGNEDQKSGAWIDDVPNLVSRIREIPSLDLRGLMAIPPAHDDPRFYFRELRALRDAASLPELSMGMTDDFEIAIEEGATIIRVGRAIFGLRG